MRLSISDQWQPRAYLLPFATYGRL